LSIEHITDETKEEIFSESFCLDAYTYYINLQFYSVTCIHDTCTATSSCMYGSPPSPNCLPLHVHEKLAMSQQQLIIYLLVMDD
jgi:hypothetical protein